MDSLENYLLICCLLAALGLFAVARPRWRNIGPSLLDSFVIGLFLFALGSVLVWLEGLARSETVMRIGISAAISGTLGASLWSRLLSARIANLNFFADARRFRADRNEHLAVSAGLVISITVSVILLAAVISHEHIRQLLLAAFLKGEDTFNEARIIVSSGAEGYFAPGYVKQFRDIIIPILCVVAILCGGTYRHRGLIYVAVLVGLATSFVSGQRLVLVQYILCFGTAFLIDYFSSRPRFAPLFVVIMLLSVMIGAVGLMTKLLGRLDVAPVPSSDLQKERVLRRIEAVEARVKAATRSTSQASLVNAQKELEYAQAEADLLQQAITRLQQGGELPPDVLSSLISRLPTPIASAVALAYRAVIAVPRENTVYYFFWAGRERAYGSGWITDLGGVLPGTQRQLSNDLSDVNKIGGMGNSPLGLATNVYYNWGWTGVIVVPVLYALAFLLLDIGLAAADSPLTSAAKIFMFFAIPTMYSPFMFILYGGFVAVAILCYVWLLGKGAFSFLGLRPQTRQSHR